MEKLVQQTYQILSRVARATWWSKDWLIKLLSLGLGIFLWYFVAGADQVDSTITMPIELVNLPTSLVIANPSFKQEIEVSLRGPRSLVQGARDQHLSRRVDLSKAQPGPFTIQNSGDTINLPRGLSLVRLQPTNIVLQLDRLSQKNLPIHPVSEGVLAPGYALRHVTLSPDNIRVSGPKTLLDGINTLQTRAIDINGLRDTTTKQVPVTIPPELLELIGETVVSATIEIGLHMQQLRLDHINIETIPPDAASHIHPKTVNVEVLLPAKLLLGKGKPSQLLRAVVTVPDNGSTGTLPVTIQATGSDKESKEIKVLEVNPAHVQVAPAAPPPAATTEGGAKKAADAESDKTKAPTEQDGAGKKSPTTNKEKKSAR